jgi:uncharacterized repeat protein (TIGR03943 family)
VTRDTQHMVLLLLGGALLRISADDTYLRYVRPSHRWLLIGAGLAIVVLAAVALVRDLGKRPTHGHRQPAAWLLMLPVLVIALVAPPALGADTVSRAANANTAQLEASVFPPLPAGEAPEIRLGEFVQRAMFDTSGTLDARTVTLVGFAVRRGAEVDLARLRITCCAADARPSVVRLVGDVGAPEPDTWLRVTAVLQPGTATAATHWIPTVSVRAVAAAAVPSDPYEY